MLSKKIEFKSEAKLENHRDVRFDAIVSGKLVRCYVAFEALKRRIDRANPDPLQTFNIHRAYFESLAHARISADDFSGEDLWILPDDVMRAA